MATRNLLKQDFLAHDAPADDAAATILIARRSTSGAVLARPPPRLVAPQAHHPRDGDARSRRSAADAALDRLIEQVAPRIKDAKEIAASRLSKASAHFAKLMRSVKQQFLQKYFGATIRADATTNARRLLLTGS